MKPKRRTVPLLLLVVILAACGDAETPVVTPTVAPQSTNVAVVAPTDTILVLPEQPTQAGGDILAQTPAISGTAKQSTTTTRATTPPSATTARTAASTPTRTTLSTNTTSPTKTSPTVAGAGKLSFVWKTTGNTVGLDSAGNVYVSITADDTVRRLDAQGKPNLTMGGSDKLSQPGRLAVSPAGFIYVVDIGNKRIQKFGADAKFVRSIGGAGDGNGQFTNLIGVSVDKTGNVYSIESFGETGRGASRIQKFDPQAKFLSKWSGSGSNTLGTVADMVVSKADLVYVLDMGNSRVQKFDSIGKFLASWRTPDGDSYQDGAPGSIAIDVAGSVYIADGNKNRVQKFSNAGKLVATWDGNADDTNFNIPVSIAVDAVGNIYIADSSATVRKFGQK